MRATLPLLTAALVLSGATSVASQKDPQEGGGSDWPRRIERVAELLDKGKWKTARKVTNDLVDEMTGGAWERPGIRRDLATLGRYLAIAEVNLGMERRAVWHWLAAWNLLPPRDLTELARKGHADSLLELSLRRLGEMPPGFSRPGDLEQLRIEEARLPAVDRPILTNEIAHRGGRLPDALIEVVIDREGRLLHPVVDNTGVPAVALWATLEWLLSYPAAQPAMIDGEPIDLLRMLTIEFGRDRGAGAVFFEPGVG